jgi:2-oxoisovalerate dehydrogenase E2 component (dihydrolipoyl transacylase)
MGIHAIKLPDVGEGVAEAELVEWHVAVGDLVKQDDVIAAVMTDKATVEIPSPVAGVVSSLNGEPGDVLAVGGDLVGIELDDGATPPDPDTDPEPADVPAAVVPAPPAPDATLPPPAAPVEPATVRQRVLAAPAVRARAAGLSIDLAGVTGSGPDGRVVHADLDRHLLAGRTPAATSGTPSERVDEQPIRGLRRQIADRLTVTWREVPHITYVESVDATELEALRAELNRRGHPSGGRLTLLPFVARAIALACREQPRINARYDSESQTLSVVDAVHLGIATQTPDGLMVPVVRHVERRSLWDLAGAIAAVADAAREAAPRASS